MRTPCRDALSRRSRGVRLCSPGKLESQLLSRPERVPDGDVFVRARSKKSLVLHLCGNHHGLKTVAVQGRGGRMRQGLEIDNRKSPSDKRSWASNVGEQSAR